MIKRILQKATPKYLQEIYQGRRYVNQIKDWNTKGYGYPFPPSENTKQNIVRTYQAIYGYNTLIETGTYLGEMVNAQKNYFNKIISIELSLPLFEKAQQRFEGIDHIQILQGDSSLVLPLILKDTNEPVIFWLDGHYSGGITAKGKKECPIYEEIDAIFASSSLNHILLIDDARLFIGKRDYPTIDELYNYVQSKNRGYKIEVLDDIIRLTPQPQHLIN